MTSRCGPKRCAAAGPQHPGDHGRTTGAGRRVTRREQVAHGPGPVGRFPAVSRHDVRDRVSCPDWSLVAARRSRSVSGSGHGRVTPIRLGRRHSGARRDGRARPRHSASRRPAAVVGGPAPVGELLADGVEHGTHRRADDADG